VPAIRSRRGVLLDHTSSRNGFQRKSDVNRTETYPSRLITSMCCGMVSPRYPRCRIAQRSAALVQVDDDAGGGRLQGIQLLADGSGYTAHILSGHILRAAHLVAKEDGIDRTGVDQRGGGRLEGRLQSTLPTGCASHPLACQSLDCGGTKRLRPPSAFQRRSRVHNASRCTSTDFGEQFKDP